MTQIYNTGLPPLLLDTLTIQSQPRKTDKIIIGYIMYDNCGHKKDPFGGKVSSKLHFNFINSLSTWACKDSLPDILNKFPIPYSII